MGSEPVELEFRGRPTCANLIADPLQMMNSTNAEIIRQLLLTSMSE